MIGNGSAELQGVLKAAGYRSGPQRRQWPGPGTGCRIYLHFWISSAAAMGLMVLAAALITPQPLFDVDCGLIGAFIGVGRHSLGFEQRSGIQVQHAFCVKSEAILADGGMPRIAAPEIFRHRFFDTVDNSLPQGRADVDVFARNAQRHWFASIFRPADYFS
jgi:hypothetical protein